MTDHRFKSWICCQLGGREHYAIPRALQRRDALDCLITDMWVRPGSVLASTRRNLRERFNPDLLNTTVCAATMRTLAFETRARLRKLADWNLMSERNKWFQQRAIDALSRRYRKHEKSTFNLFTYSYAGRDLLEFASAQGWRTVLGQIDAGPPEERIVSRIAKLNPMQIGEWHPAPSEYWDSWRKECALADHIVVNSDWSHAALLEEGIAAEKICVIPLAFEGVEDIAEFQREYPVAFSRERPMRVLFLGQINLRKGIEPLLEAVRILRGDPVEFWFVGPIQIAVPAELKQTAQVRWVGAVPRGEAAKYYREADLFVFPTFSDGFGLTQLEAQAWKLPIVASRFCGNVVCDGINGILLPEITCEAIASALLDLVNNPSLLCEMAKQSGVDDRFSLNSLASSLLNL
jgi:glycosyltransferase involved in cell wall biosynthesis